MALNDIWRAPCKAFCLFFFRFPMLFACAMFQPMTFSIMFEVYRRYFPLLRIIFRCAKAIRSVCCLLLRCSVEIALNTNINTWGTAGGWLRIRSGRRYGRVTQLRASRQRRTLHRWTLHRARGACHIRMVSCYTPLTHFSFRLDFTN